MRVRLAAEADLPRLPEIELSAVDAFLNTSMPPGPLSTATPAEGWRDALNHATLWVVDDEQGTPIGFLGAHRDGGELHILEFDVEAAHQGKGLGRQLLNHVIGWARTEGLSELTLTTFRNIPWNGPFYAAMGFAEISDADMPSHLAETLEAERARNLEERCAMRLTL
ncbi:GNAT family N-acetyltransferase [Phenylobacterium sp.]|uniref:GNAT family N-acetyltransferase n=1 Tax=Phenylobacterium sp. TaxID=1871053 RepID=UPI002719C699|nr:GNAT family N-acetyltransferase [Phenylobacterium sp.]MDO8378999.1 GNAT family N-acetyltransferase [Phenylobacterium sp.]